MTKTVEKSDNSRDHKIKFIFLIAALIGVCILYFVQKRDLTMKGWSNDLPATLKKAKSADRPICILFVNSPPSAIDQKVKVEVSAGKCQKALKDLKFLPVIVSLKSVDNPVAKKYEVKSLPTLITLHPDGTVKNRHQGEIGRSQFKGSFLTSELTPKNDEEDL